MAECSVDLMPNQLRTIYATLICFCQVADPVKLFLDYRGKMEEDYTAAELLQDKIFKDLHSLLIENGIQDGLLHLNFPGDMFDKDNLILEDSLEDDVFETDCVIEKSVENIALLNEEQTIIFNNIVEDCSRDQLFFVDGPGFYFNCRRDR